MVVQGSNGIKTLLDFARALHLRRDAASLMSFVKRSATVFHRLFSP
jgi:hypothetical protein